MHIVIVCFSVYDYDDNSCNVAVLLFILLRYIKPIKATEKRRRANILLTPTWCYHEMYKAS